MDEKPLIERVAEAYLGSTNAAGPGPRCPFSNNPLPSVATKEVPLQIRGLVGVWIELRERASTMNAKTSFRSGDDAAWFAAQHEAEAAETLVVNLLRCSLGQPLGTKYEFYACWQYAVRRPDGLQPKAVWKSDPTCL